MLNSSFLTLFTHIFLFKNILLTWFPNTTIFLGFIISISLYNSLNDIKNAQVTVTNQNTNLSVLDKSKYPVQLNELMDNPARYIDLITESFVSYWYRKYHHE